MTDIQAVLAEMRAALEKATPGPMIHARDVIGDGYRIIRQSSERQPIIAVGVLPNDAPLLVLLHNKAAALLDVAEAASRHREKRAIWIESPSWAGPAFEDMMVEADMLNAKLDELGRLSGATPEEARR